MRSTTCKKKESDFSVRDTLWLQWKWVNGNRSWHAVTVARRRPISGAAKPHILGEQNTLNWQLQALSGLPRTKTRRKKHYSAQFGYNEPTQQWLPIFSVQITFISNSFCRRSALSMLERNHNNKHETNGFLVTARAWNDNTPHQALRRGCGEIKRTVTDSTSAVAIFGDSHHPREVRVQADEMETVWESPNGAVKWHYLG